MEQIGSGGRGGRRRKPKLILKVVLKPTDNVTILSSISLTLMVRKPTLEIESNHDTFKRYQIDASIYYPGLPLYHWSH